jgi:membrane-associated phospholipid phosphatase
LQLGAAFPTYLVGRATNSPRAAVVGADLFRAQLLAQGTTYALKYSIRRVRPDDTSFSFPSGHTAVSFASATVLQRHFGWKIGVPAYAPASYVGASWIQAKRHYFSDVAFGAALGIVAGRSVTVGRGDGCFAVAPMAAPGGGGVGFTWIGNKGK